MNKGATKPVRKDRRPILMDFGEADYERKV